MTTALEPSTFNHEQSLTIEDEAMEMISLEKQVESKMLFLDSNLVKEYQRAKEVIPSIVRQETKIRDFLLVEQNDPERAAIRLAKYWKVRKLIYKDRWLLPMTMTGLGTLTPFQVEIVRSGFTRYVFSPNNGLVMMTDWTLLPKGSVHAQFEIMFYFMTIFPGKMKSIFVVRSGEKPAMSLTDMVRRVLEAVPVTVLQQYVVQAYEGGKEHLMDFLGYQHRRVTETNTTMSVIQIAGNSIRDTLQQLEAHGFDRYCLPRDLGGNIDQRQFNDFVRARLTVEEIMSAAPPMANIVFNQGGRGAPMHLAVAARPNQPQQQLQQQQQTITTLAGNTTRKRQRAKETLEIPRLPNETEQQYTRRKNAIYVRRTYHREKLELMQAKDEAAKCEEMNKALKGENQRLQYLLMQANWFVLYGGGCNNAPPGWM